MPDNETVDAHGERRSPEKEPFGDGDELKVLELASIKVRIMRIRWLS
jgi:hypothetical protein